MISYNDCQYPVARHLAQQKNFGAFDEERYKKKLTVETYYKNSFTTYVLFTA